MKLAQYYRNVGSMLKPPRPAVASRFSEKATKQISFQTRSWSASLVWMPMVHIRIVRVHMDLRLMNVGMRVRLAAIPIEIVRVSMVFVMNVSVRMFFALVRM